MSPRRSAAEAALTRESIIARGLSLASVEGLCGLTIGRLATGPGSVPDGPARLYLKSFVRAPGDQIALIGRRIIATRTAE